jgi:hypothetical protein
MNKQLSNKNHPKKLKVTTKKDKVLCDQLMEASPKYS